MNFQQWIIKTFHKKEAVKLIFVGRDRRVRVHWVVPNQDDTIQYGDRAYLLHDEKVYYQEGIPCIFINPVDAEPLDMILIGRNLYNAVDFGTAIGSNVTKDLMNSTKRKTVDFALYVSLALFGLMGYMWYTFSTELSSISDQLQSLIGG